MPNGKEQANMGRYCPYIDGRTVYTSCGECEKPICGGDVFFCLVVGSRGFDNYELMRQKLDALLVNHKNTVIVTGGARGTDSLAERYGEEKGYPVIVIRAEWDKYAGKQAGYLRNEKMHRFIAKQDNRGCVAFWDGKSRGTAHSFSLAEKYGNQIRIIRVCT